MFLMNKVGKYPVVGISIAIIVIRIAVIAAAVKNLSLAVVFVSEQYSVLLHRMMAPDSLLMTALLMVMNLVP